LLEEPTDLCQFGADNNPNNCASKAFFDFSGADNVPMITGMWDLESAGNQWTGDNAFYNSYSLFCRELIPEPFDAGEACKGRETGEYVNDNGVNVDCDADSFGGGWTKISSLT
jgi:hypothetical protein